MNLIKKKKKRTADVFASDGGIKLVLSVMRKHGLVVAVQEYGIGLLSSILKANTNAVICDEFVDEEGISTVLAAMMIHPKHGPIQLYGFDVLIHLLTSKSGIGISIHKEYKRRIVEETNAVNVVTDAVNIYHKKNPKIQDRGSTLLKMLSFTYGSSSSSTPDYSAVIQSALPFIKSSSFDDTCSSTSSTADSSYNNAPSAVFSSISSHVRSSTQNMRSSTQNMRASITQKMLSL